MKNNLIYNLPQIFILTIFTFILSYFAIQSYKESMLLNNEFIKTSEINYIDNKLKETTSKTKEFLKKETEEIISITKNVFNNKLNKWSNNILGQDIIKIEKKENIITTEKNNTMKKSIDIKNKLNYYSFIYFGLLFALFIILVLSLNVSFINENVIIFFMLISSIISLVIGILSPIITMEVFKELPILGYTVLKYETKSIFGTIYKLVENNNILIAILISVFSVVIPTIKTIIMFISLFSYKSISFIDKIGKWSMADVFVVSIFIAILSLNTDKFTKAEPQIGLYFFASYVLLSMFSSFVITHRKNHESSKLNINITLDKKDKKD